MTRAFFILMSLASAFVTYVVIKAAPYADGEAVGMNDAQSAIMIYALIALFGFCAMIFAVCATFSYKNA